MESHHSKVGQHIQLDLRDLETLDPLYIASKHSEDAIIPTTLRFLNRIDPIGRAVQLLCMQLF